MGKRIDIDPFAGFCFGVEKAIEVAEKCLEEGEEVYGLGQMVHNEAETERLNRLGLTTISTADFSRITSGKVLLRAHGEPPSTYDEARRHAVELIDATCPIVSRLQKKIQKKYLSLKKEEEQIVIYGKKGHPETVGLLGQTNNEAILITDPNDIQLIQPGKKIYLFSQTTMDPDQYDLLLENIKKTHLIGNSQALEANCTICGQMKKRKPELKKFAHAYDTIIFLSGKHSSNGKMLFEYCKSFNEQTYWIHMESDIDPQWIVNAVKIGITGATSTPAWQLRQVREYIRNLVRDTQKDAGKT